MFIIAIVKNVIFAEIITKHLFKIMLLSAKFENIYSFKEETRILFTASKSDQ